MNTQHSATAGFMGLFNIYPGLSKSSKELLSVWIFDANLIDFTQLPYWDSSVREFVRQELAEQAAAVNDSDVAVDKTSEDGDVGSFTAAVREEIIELMHRDFNTMQACNARRVHEELDFSSTSGSGQHFGRHRTSSILAGSTDMDGIVTPREVSLTPRTV